MDKSLPVVISLGGSLVIPNGGIDTQFLKDFNLFIRQKIARGWRFFIVVGGGATARHYIDSAREIVGQISDWDLDFLGIHTTQLNAHMIRTIFRDVAHPRVIMNYQKKIVNLQEPLVIAAGWKPGCSTDYDAMLLVRDYGAKALINMSNIDSVYDKDPKKYPQAKPLKKISWKDFRKNIVGYKWLPGKNSPFDPIASGLAEKFGLRVAIMNGNNLTEVKKALEGRGFKGTVIE